MIGKGGYSTVISAHNITNNTPVAVKIIHREQPLNEQVLSRVYEEVDMLRKLQHDNIIHILDFYEEPNAYYIVLGMKFIYVSSQPTQ